jgi:hypothetical protein
LHDWEDSSQTDGALVQANVGSSARRVLIESFEKARLEGEQVTALTRRQAVRREKVEAQAADLRRKQHRERMQLAAAQKGERQAFKAAYLAAQKRIRVQRAQRRPRGLAAFLGRISGAALMIRKIQRYRDPNDTVRILLCAMR